MVGNIFIAKIGKKKHTANNYFNIFDIQFTGVVNKR